jgi:hypothetical protein
MATYTEIKNALNTYFSLGEINTLCFDLGIPYEEIRREGKTNTITALVEYAGRMAQLGQVIAYINKARPHANLSPGVPKPGQTAAPPPQNQPPAIHVEGDYIAGDKVGGDQVDGDKISAGDISGTAIIGRGGTAASQTNTGDTYTFSGNFSGAILNVNATLKNVTQTIGALPRADDETKAELQQLVAQLQDTLQQVPADKSEDAEAVAKLTGTFMDMANEEKPNKQLLQITGEGLKQAAKNLAAIVPDVVKIAGAIVSAVLAL